MADYESAPSYRPPNKPLAGYDPHMMDAPNQMINVAHEATSSKCACTPGNCSCGPSCGCMCCWGNGPGGKSTIIQYNEKGILEEGLMHLISMGTSASLYGEHDNYQQGIYAEGSDEGFEGMAGY